MRGADYARLGVDEQDHAAVGAGDAETKAGRRGDQRVATRPRFARERRRDRQRVGRVDLKRDRQTLGRDRQRSGHARAVLAHRLGFVVRADAAVERSVDARGDAAAAGEECVRDAGQLERRGAEGLGRRHAGFAGLG